MRNMILLIVLVVMGCESENHLKQQDGVVGTWKLAEVISGWTNETTSASSLDYQEFYEFKADSTMRKYRSSGEEALGVYHRKELSDGTYFEIIYNNPDASLKESCGDNEFLRITDSRLKGGSLPCDGPGLVYEKVAMGKE